MSTTHLHEMPSGAQPVRRPIMQRLRVLMAPIRATVVRRAEWFVAALALYRLVGLGFGEMQAWDEALYALRAMGIRLFGVVWDQSAVLPDGAYYAAHPPLHVWTSVFWTLFFGIDVWVFRLTSALAAAALVVLVYRFMLRRTTREAALLACAFLAGAPLVTFYSRQGQVDLLLALCMVLATLGAAAHARTGRRMPLAGAVLALGAALMTKMLFALIVPAALVVAGFRTEGTVRRRLVTAAVLLPILSLPLWLPWLWSWIAAHAGGDVRALVEGRTPLGRTLGGGEGVAKASGALFYLNQLVVELSVLFPLFATALARVAMGREGTTITVLGAVTFVHLVVVHLPASTFAVYLIPMLPLAIVLAVHVLQQVVEWDPGEQAAMLALMALSAIWSASDTARASSLSVFRTLARLAEPQGGDVAALLLLLVAAALALTGVFLLHRRNLAGRAVWPLAVAVTCIIATATCVRIWLVDPTERSDGAQIVAERALELPVREIVLIGDGENPQLTWYLGGRDAGWITHEERRYTRLQPRLRGVEGVRGALEGMHADGAVGVIFEKEFVVPGIPRYGRDMLPASAHLMLEAPRYALYVLR